MKYLKLYNQDNTLADNQIIVDDNVFDYVKIYDYYYFNNEVYRNTKRMQYFYNNISDTYTKKIIKDRIYLSKMIAEYLYGEYVGFSKAFKIGYRDGNPFNLCNDNLVFWDNRYYSPSQWYPEKSHLNPCITT